MHVPTRFQARLANGAAHAYPKTHVQTRYPMPTVVQTVPPGRVSMHTNRRSMHTVVPRARFNLLAAILYCTQPRKSLENRAFQLSDHATDSNARTRYLVQHQTT